MKTPERVQRNEMPGRPMNAEPPQPTAEGKTRSPQEGEMPTRAMDEPIPSIPAPALSPREQDKSDAYRRDQAARTATAGGKHKMPTEK